MPKIETALGLADSGLCKSSHEVPLPLIIDGHMMAEACFPALLRT
jgi:hypothetical protein